MFTNRPQLQDRGNLATNRPSKKKSGRMLPCIESLESLRMQSSDITAWLSPLGATITFSYDRMNHVVQDYVSPTTTGHLTMPLGVTRIVVYGGAGNDRIVNNTSLPMLAYGDNGNDIIVGGSSGDVLYGGAGNDSLNGMGGSDRLYGD